MMFSKREIDMYTFYESLSDDQRMMVDDKLRNIIPELKLHKVGEGEIYDLKCVVAKDMFKPLRG